jgi:hypothetical protein
MVVGNGVVWDVVNFYMISVQRHIRKVTNLVLGAKQAKDHSLVATTIEICIPTHVEYWKCV